MLISQKQAEIELWKEVLEKKSHGNFEKKWPDYGAKKIRLNIPISFIAFYSTVFKRCNKGTTTNMWERYSKWVLIWETTRVYNLES